MKKHNATLVSLNASERKFWNDKLNNNQRYNESEYIHVRIFNEDKEKLVQLKMKTNHTTFDTEKIDRIIKRLKISLRKMKWKNKQK